MLLDLKEENKSVGVKESVKRMENDPAKKVFAARDADINVIRPVLSAAERAGVPIEWVSTMAELGRACGIDVGAAVCVLY